MKIAPGLLLAVSVLAAQTAHDTPDAHILAAKVAAGDDFQNLFQFQCYGPGPGVHAQPLGAQRVLARAPFLRGSPGRRTDRRGMPSP